MSFEDEAKRVRNIIKRFPKVFGLRKFPGERFSIGETSSMFCGENLVYVENDAGGALFKGTPEALAQQIVPLQMNIHDDTGKIIKESFHLGKSNLVSNAHLIYVVQRLEDGSIGDKPIWQEKKATRNKDKALAFAIELPGRVRVIAVHEDDR